MGKQRLTLLLAALWIAQTASAMDYVELKSGRIFEGAVIRQDTVAVFVSDWDSRHEKFPDVQVFSRDEISAIWFGSKPETKSMRKFIPESGMIELGGMAAMQTWASSQYHRRNFVMLTLSGGYTIVPQFGVEVDGDFTIPFGGDGIWDRYNFGHQLTLNVVVHPVTWKGMTPFALAGGGSSSDVPLGDLVLTNELTARNLVNFGGGVKWGSGHLGYRLEVRHSYSSWTPDETTEFGTRVPRQDLDATTVRFGLFGFF